MDKQPMIAFIGAGHMTKSLISGLIESGIEASRLWVTDRHPEKLKQLAKKFGLQTDTSNLRAAKLADVLVLSVKPQDIHALAIELKDVLHAKKPLIISIAAGIHTQHLEEWLDASLAIVRAMPNTPALLRAGATGLYANARVSDAERDLAESLLRAVGVTVWLNHEHDLDIVTALSGSGPAYFFLIMEALQQGAEALGLSSRIAKLLTLQTALGAARMALESEVDLKELRVGSTSPGGTTERGLEALEKGGIRELLQNALQSAKERSVEISQLFDKE